jgi:myo-inositol-1(or 4)-monophosphatase
LNSDKKIDIFYKGHISETIDMNLERIKTVGIGAAYNGGRVLRSFLGNIKTPDHKGAIDLVTEADLGSEKVIIASIREAFPDHAILAEESGMSGENPASRWIIDPLDGTTNYTHQLGLFGVSIAFEMEGKIAVGIVLNPVTGELFSAVRGQGAELNGRPIHVSETRLVSESLLVTGFPYNFSEILKEVMGRFANCQRASQGVRRLGSASLDLCFLACGRFEGFWEQNLKPWDTAAGYLIAREAGAHITDFSNRAFSIYGNEVLATNGWIHEDMLGLLKEDA